MKQFIFGFLVAVFALFGSNAEAQVQGPIYCGASFLSANVVAASTVAVTTVPAGSARVLICGFDIVVTGTTSAEVVTFLQGTQTTTPCDTNPVAITPAFPLATSAPSLIQEQVDIWRGLATARGTQLCIQFAGTTISSQVQVFYTIQ